jgi:V8-like Glu-specific endopeptidase
MKLLIQCLFACSLTSFLSGIASLRVCAEVDISITVKKQGLVYGEDTRQEAREHANPILRRLARKSVVSLIPKNSLFFEEERVLYEASTLREESDVCPSERFEQQPVLADCSGVIVDRDLVLTAGHCITTQTDCDESYFVLDFTIDSQEMVHLDPINVFECKEIIRSEISHFSEPTVYDYALIRLKRPVDGQGIPVSVRSEQLSRGESISLIGNGLGLPTKIDSDGRVVLPGSPERDYFTFQADFFHRGSGSPIFDEVGRLVGIAVRGGTDFDGKTSCQEIRVEPQDSPYSEEASYASESLIRAGYAHLVENGDDVDSGPKNKREDKDMHAGCHSSPFHGTGSSNIFKMLHLFIELLIQ